MSGVSDGWRVMVSGCVTAGDESTKITINKNKTRRCQQEEEKGKVVSVVGEEDS